MTRFWQFAFVGLVLAVVYLSLRSSPAIVSVPLIPHGLSAWFDRHDVFKNLIGFTAVGFAGFMAVGAGPSQTVWPGRDRSVVLLVALGGLIVLLELLQVALPRRTSSVRDVVVGWTGVAVAWGAARWIRRRGQNGRGAPHS